MCALQVCAHAAVGRPGGRPAARQAAARHEPAGAGQLSLGVWAAGLQQQPAARRVPAASSEAIAAAGAAAQLHHPKSEQPVLVGSSAGSAAVLDLQQCMPDVLRLARAASQQWDRGVAAKDLRQLHQVHLWLLDCGLPATPGPQGLSGCLTAQQLQQCRASWQQQLDDETAVADASRLQLSVFSALHQLPASTWLQEPVMEQRTADDAFSIDIAAVTAAGQQLAVEADGPWHFVRPGRALNGPTQARNRALAARGCRVLSVPWWEWAALKGSEQQQAYLVELLQRAGGGDDEQPRQGVRRKRPAPTPAPGGAAVPGGARLAPSRVRRVRRTLGPSAQDS